MSWLEPPCRAWVNQPSGLQPYHALHGQNVIVARHEYDDTYEVFFLEGDIISQQLLGSALSPGWLRKEGKK